MLLRMASLLIKTSDWKIFPPFFLPLNVSSTGVWVCDRYLLTLEEPSEDIPVDGSAESRKELGVFDDNVASQIPTLKRLPLSPTSF